MASKIFAEMLRQVEPETKQYVAKNLAISRQVRHILAGHPTIRTQKDLAEALGKEPSEISKWLSGLHNIGLENITKMETVLGQDIILTVEQAKERYASPPKGEYRVIQRISRPEQAIQSADGSFDPQHSMIVYPVRKQSARREPGEMPAFA